jgi:phospholipase/carboxylesterase
LYALGLAGERPTHGDGFARQARELLKAGGLPVSYHESDAGHHIDPAHSGPATEWLAAAIPS